MIIDTTDVNPSDNHTPLTSNLVLADVPEFCMTAPALRDVVDQIADNAMSGLQQVTTEMASAPADMLPLLTSLRALFSSIGRAADGTAEDVGADLNEAWSLSLP